MSDSKKPMYIFTELGKEKLCNDYYPLDDEFFYHRNKKTKAGVHKQYEAVCKACYPVHYNKQTNGRNRIRSKHEKVAA